VGRIILSPHALTCHSNQFAHKRICPSWNAFTTKPEIMKSMHVQTGTEMPQNVANQMQSICVHRQGKRSCQRQAHMVWKQFQWQTSKQVMKYHKILQNRSKLFSFIHKARNLVSCDWSLVSTLSPPPFPHNSLFSYQ
jgi:hypothetical protein